MTTKTIAGVLLAAALSMSLLGPSRPALAVKASPPTVYCSPAECEVCTEYEHTEAGDRCLKCEITDTALCTDKTGEKWKPGPERYAMVKNDVDVYDRPVKPRKVIGMMAGGSGARILDYHPHGWCKLDLGAFPYAHDSRAEGWIAQDHLKNCP